MPLINPSTQTWRILLIFYLFLSCFSNPLARYSKLVTKCPVFVTFYISLVFIELWSFYRHHVASNSWDSFTVNRLFFYSCMSIPPWHFLILFIPFLCFSFYITSTQSIVNMDLTVSFPSDVVNGNNTQVLE